MKTYLGWAATLVAATVLASPAAMAASRKHHAHHAPPPPAVAVHDAYIGPFNIGDPNVFWGGVIVGGAATGAYFAIDHYRPLKVMGDGRHFSTGAFVLTTAGCMAVAPMLSAALVWNAEHRPLTSREALGLGVGCIIPIIGPLLVDSVYASHPEWTP